NTTVSNCDILDSESYGAYSWGSATRYPVIEDCFIRNATRGIYILDGDDAAIRNNVIIHCSIQGIYVFGAPAQYGEIHLNVIEDNQVGIYVLTSDYYSITNNTVRWNMDYGVRLSGSTGSGVYYNLIALNGDNGDDTSSFDWDDGVSMGNWWDDYTPPGPYAVDGNTDDNYPMQYLVYEPIINSPSDIYYPEGSTGNELVWLPFDDSLRNWQVTIDGSVRAADAWNFADITVNIDGLSYGTHTAVVTVWDIEENSVTDTVLIHVYDDTPPTLSSQPHAIAFIDGSGQTVTWEASDAHPGTYTVFMDEEEFAAGSWSTGIIEINIDGQTEGMHVFYMVVRDLDGNSAGDTVKVLFLDDNTDPTIDSPDDITYTHGTTGNNIIWSPSDDYPDTYRVTIDGELLMSAAWGGSRVVVVVDGLDVGEYVFELTVFDGSGNSQSDSVAVIVEALEPTGPPPIQIDPAVLLAVAAIAGGAVVVIVIVYLIRKRRAG
ncbi:MAG: right-handed parallel beta-helix repeat-containing protein, partial [Candidatus Thorarchaeota archaeon]